MSSYNNRQYNINRQLCNTTTKQVLYYEILGQFGDLPINLVVEMATDAEPDSDKRKNELLNIYSELKNLAKHSAIVVQNECIGLSNTRNVLHIGRGRIDCLWLLVFYFKGNKIPVTEMYKAQKYLFPEYRRPIRLGFINPVNKNSYYVAVINSVEEIATCKFMNEYMQQQIDYDNKLRLKSREYAGIYGIQHIPETILLILTYEQRVADMIPVMDALTTCVYLVKRKDPNDKTERPEIVEVHRYMKKVK